MELPPAQRATLLARVHFGNHVREGGLVDAGLDGVASGHRGLGEWLEMIAKEALGLNLLPGLCHPEISRAAVARQWTQAEVVTCGPEQASWPDLAALGDYPANSAWAPAPFGQRAG